MKDIFVIILLVASFLSFKNAMRIPVPKSSDFDLNNYYDNLDKSDFDDRDPRLSCRCPHSGIKSCPCDRVLSGEKVKEEPCECPKNDHFCKCQNKRRNHKRTDMDQDINSIMFLQKLFDRLDNDSEEPRALYLSPEED